MWQTFTTDQCRISSRLKWYKNYKNRLRLAKVVKNKMSRFYGSVCYLWPLCVADADIIFLSCFFMVALCNRADHYIFALWFLSIYLLFSSPNLSGRRLDVYHTLTHGVALERIYNAGLKAAARGSLANAGPKKVAKNRHLGSIPQIFVGLYLCI